MLAYANVNQKAIADKLGVSPATMGRMAGGRKDSRKGIDHRYLTAVADATHLPIEFFYADFTRLREIVPPGTVVIGRRSDGEELWPPLPPRAGEPGSQAS